MRVATHLARALRSAGIDTMFGLMGDGNLDHVMAFREGGGRFVAALAEGGAVSMADGWSRTTGRIGVASVTHGPGMTNTLTALTEAARARTPLLLLTGDTPDDPQHLQRFDLAGAAALTGAEYVRVRADDAPNQIAAALARVAASSVPLVLDVPVAVGRENVAADAPAPRLAEHPAAPLDDGELDEALGIVAGARRPLVLAGRGAVLSGARAEVLSLARVLGAPTATTLLAREFLADDPHDLGIAGTLSDPEIFELLCQADCVIAVGAGLNRFTTGDGALLAGGPVVQIDARAEAFGRHLTPKAGVLGDARNVLSAMTTALEGAGVAPSSWRETCRERVERMPQRVDPEPETDRVVDLGAALTLLDELLPRDRLVATDTGRFIYTAWRRLSVSHPTDFVHTLNFASIGLGVATGIGVAAAHPERLTVVVAGDGGAMMGLGELTTAVRERLPLLVVIADDAAYGMEYHHLQRAGMDPAAAATQWPSFAEVARGYGARGYEVADLDQLRRVVAEIGPHPAGPVVVALKVDPRNVRSD